MTLSEQIENYRPYAESICQRLRDEIAKLGFPPGAIDNLPDYQQAEFKLVKDPYTGADNLSAHWHDAHRQRIGHVQFNSDGTFYAEYDVVKPHPGKSGYFVEAVSAWGKAGGIKAEAKLLAMPG